MTENNQVTQEQVVPAQNDKEYNFSQIRKQLESERLAKQQLEQRLSEMEKAIQSRQSAPSDEEESDDEPYVDHKKLTKKLDKFAQKSKQETQSEIQRAVQQALAEKERNDWLKNNPDFQDILEKHGEALARNNPDLAESILEIQDPFARQKLAYKTIKSMSLHKPPEEKPSIQETIDRNRRTPGYQPSGTASAPYGSFSAGNVTPEQGKKAYQQLQELKKRIGG